MNKKRVQEIFRQVARGTVGLYRTPVNHPLVQPVYEEWKRARGIPSGCPLSDKEREEFELEIDRIIGLETMDKLAKRLLAEREQKKREEYFKWLSTKQQ